MPLARCTHENLSVHGVRSVPHVLWRSRTFNNVLTAEEPSRGLRDGVGHALKVHCVLLRHDATFKAKKPRDFNCEA